MKMIIKSKEINKVAKILANNNFINVKNMKNLEKYIFTCLSNYYILSIKNNFKAKIIFNKDEKNYTSILFIIINDYNFLFNELVEIKKENIEIEIVDGGDNE